jgi:DNA-binding response OmpR family regulator
MEAKKKILVIEDDNDVRRTLELRLELEGFEAIGASEGYEGIYKAEKSGASLIILDLKLPGLPGEEICKQLRKKDEYESVPIIMLTAKGSDADRVIGKVIGADCYIRKPFDMDELLEKVHSLI